MTVENRFLSFEVALQDGPQAAADRLDTELQQLGYVIITNISKTVNLFSERTPYYHFSILYRRAAGMLYRAKLFSASTVAQAEADMNAFLTSTDAVRAFDVLDLTESLANRPDTAHLVLIYDLSAPWPLGENFDNFPVIARATTTIPPNGYGYVVAVSFNLVTTARFVRNAGPYTWQAGKDGILYYNKVNETLTGFPTGCNVYGP